ncbi:Glucose 1,6-bisphosphate synthase [Dufourea novaeangliae]|uniref:Glucose 1,6-bisphosphate synthase n=1 Tax=Dufourea novaeangliae TaxID=178035 RepID=A0A154PI01_DUFNO|nr:Glucose 1,6-bisphosphate synthase [Dufourea novaeangliae]
MATEIFVRTGDTELDIKIDEWLKWNKDQNAKHEIEKLIQNNNAKVLSDLFLKRLEFGTAGLRGCMGPGYSQMNDLVIVQTGQGLSKYLLDTVSNAFEKGVIVGYDGRHCSKRLIKSYNIISSIYITRILQFLWQNIMVTASHNPKIDNGYKVYWENGAQIISPHDKKIQKYILENLEPIESSWDIIKVYDSPLYKDPWNDIMQSYFHALKQTVLYPELNRNTILKFTYTPMHGVGYEYMTAAFNAANLKPFIIVEEQKLPDPEFPTVKFPNPEEGKSALDLSIKVANENSSSIIIANDPDADRLACATKMENGEWYIFTGNELGALLGWWMMHKYQVQHPDTDFSNVYMLASTVSSKILASMAKQEGFNFEETLTGFKWMGNRTVELKKTGKEVIFAYEEAIGFMCGCTVLDKDGINAGMQVAELSAYLETIGFTLNEKLNEIYAQYGYHISKNSYWICHEPDIIKKIFERLRNYAGEPNTYPTGILNRKYSITSVRDLTTGYDNMKPENKAILPVSKSSQMITFSFKNGLVITLRTSGTEPKIKYYSELCASPEEKDLKVLSNTLDEMVSAVVTEFLQPEINGLIPRTS